MTQNASPPQGLGGEQLPVFYMKMKSNNVHPRLGKLVPGQVIPLDQATATRYLIAGVAEQVSSSDYEDTQAKRRDKVTQRQERFRALNDQYAMWDVSTYRDVLTAPERGLRMAYDRGISLVNVHMLRDEDGDPLDPESDIEEILAARESLHAELQSPLTAHDRSSVMGGGGHYDQNVNISPQPLNPGYREVSERIASNEMFAQRRALLQEQPNAGGLSNPAAPTTPATGGRQTRAQRRAATLHGEQSSGQPGRSPESQEAAENAGVKPPSGDLNPDQRA